MRFSEIKKCFDEIKNISSTNEKKEYLKNHDDEDFKKFLKWLYSTDIISGISSKKINKEVNSDIFGDWTTCDQKDIFDVFRYLEFHKTGRDEDIANIQWYRNQICSNDEEVEFFNNVITKNVVVGMDVKLINSVYENLIPTFDVMLANSLIKLNESQVKNIFKNGTREFNCTIKADGFRCIAIKENGNVKLVSRQGKLYEGCVDIENAIKELSYDNFVLDSEIIISNRKRVPSTEQYKETSNIVTKKDCEKHGVTLNCFDYLSLEEWNNKKCKTPYYERRKILEKILKNYSDKDDKPLYLLPLLYVGTSLDEAWKLHSKAKENNEEGIMIRFSDSMMEFKRSNDLLKMKVFKDLDCYIVECIEGENKNLGKLGAFYCEIEHPTYGKLKFKCGSGMSDDERRKWWSERNSLVGRVIEVQYFEITQDSTTKEYSVRFPVCKCIKPIGTIPNN